MKFLVSISVVVEASKEDEAYELAQEKIGRGRWTDCDARICEEE